VKLPRWLTPWKKHTDQNTVTPIQNPYTLWSKFGTVVESFTGSWQTHMQLESTPSMLQFAAVYACISLRSRDIAKLRPMLLSRAQDGVWDEVTEGSPFLPVLRKPNRFQTRIQFLNYWMTSKLMYGNTYVLKDRDNRGVVRALYPLDPRGATPLVAPDGAVFYRLSGDELAGLREGVTVPASEIIHDRCMTPWHPLIGVPPLYAASSSATRGIRIQNNSETFFRNMSRPSGHLTAPGQITDEVAARLKEQFESGFSGSNLGRLLVSGDGLTFQPFIIPADQAQMIEQGEFTVEDIARAFGVPLYKIQAGELPSTDNVGALNQQYLDQTLQEDIESIELLLNEGLELPGNLRTEIDSDGLMRMDPLGRAEVYDKQVKAGLLAPNEGRFKEGRHGVKGGEQPYLQQQNFSLAALAKRDAKDDPFATESKTPAPKTPSPAANDAEGATRAAKKIDRAITKIAEELEVA
jgi:HK97 family phage portal protein